MVSQVFLTENQAFQAGLVQKPIQKPLSPADSPNNCRLGRVTAMSKTIPVTFLIILVVGGFSLIGTMPLIVAENSTTITGIITSDTTWTKADSPFILSGLVGVASGVTLTIEPGVTVNLTEYSLQVAGTLYARGGSGENNITFTSKSPTYGNIAFTNG